MKLYLVTRADLPPAARAVQLCHALREFTARFPDEDRQWYEKSNVLVLLEVASESALNDLALQAEACGVAAAAFREPDLANATTAVALGPRAKALVRNLPLALR